MLRIENTAAAHATGDVEAGYMTPRILPGSCMSVLRVQHLFCDSITVKHRDDGPTDRQPRGFPCLTLEAVA